MAGHPANLQHVPRQMDVPTRILSSVNREAVLGLFALKGDVAPIHRNAICKYDMHHHLDRSGNYRPAIQMGAS